MKPRTSIPFAPRAFVLRFLFTTVCATQLAAAAPLRELRPAAVPNVVAWGRNSYGQAVVPDDLTDAIAVAAGGEHSIALRSDGTVVGWGLNNQGQVRIPAGLKDVVAIAAGEHHNLAVQRDGTVVAWGWTNDGRCDVPPGLTDVIAVAGGAEHSLALKRDGTLVTWGTNRRGQMNIPEGLSGVTAISAGSYFSLALKRDGTVVGWGDNEYGQLDVPKGLTDAIAVSAGGIYSAVVRKDGTVVAWGRNESGSLEGVKRLTNVSALAAGTLALKCDGTVAQWGYNIPVQLCVPPGLKGITAISASRHSLALRGKPAVVAGATPAPKPGTETPDPGGDVGPGRAGEAAPGAPVAPGAAGAAGGTADEPAPLRESRTLYQAHLAQFERDYNAELDTWVKDYARAVEELGVTFQRAGNLDGWQAAKQESERFAAARLIPAAPPDGAPDALRTLQARFRAAAVQCAQRRARKVEDLTAKYVARLATLVAESTKAGKMEDAVAYNAEAKRVRGLAGIPAPKP